MRTLGTIAIMIFSLITRGLNCSVEHILRLFDLRANLRQIGQLKRCTISINQILKRNSVKGQVIVFNIKTILRKNVGLINQVEIGILHSENS